LISDFFTLSRYSERIDGFGIEKPYHSPFIAQSSEGDGWVPHNVLMGITYPDPSGRLIPVSLSHEQLDSLAARAALAAADGLMTFTFPGLPTPISVADALAAIDSLKQAFAKVKAAGRRLRLAPEKCVTLSAKD
jgi:hypothetical protein